MVKQNRISLTIVAFILFFSLRASAEDPLTGTLSTMDPRAVGLGGAMRASPSGTSGIYLNPATIAMLQLYHIELMYQYTGQDDMHMGGIAIVDSVTTMIAAGISFNYSGIRQQHTEHDQFDGRLALAASIGDVFFLGMTGRYLRVEQNQSSSGWGPAGIAALPSSGSQQVDGLTFDAGAALKLGEVLSLGVAGYNLSNTGSVFAPIKLGGGLGLHLLSMLQIEANGVVDFTSHDDPEWEIDFGTELFIVNRVAVRVGYNYDIYYDLHSLCAGLGYVGTQFALDVGFMKEVVDDGRMLLAFGFKYFIS